MDDIWIDLYTDDDTGYDRQLAITGRLTFHGSFLIFTFPGRWTTRCWWCRCTKTRWAGYWGRGWIWLPATRPSSWTARRSSCRVQSPAPEPREDSEDETTVAEQLLFLSLRGGAVLIGRTLLNFCFWYWIVKFYCSQQFFSIYLDKGARPRKILKPFVLFQVVQNRRSRYILPPWNQE